jgi:hypothetical protein
MDRGRALRFCSLSLALLACSEAHAQAAPAQALVAQTQQQAPALQQPAQTPPNTQPPAPGQSSTPAPPVPHTIAVKFDYDFNQTPACTPQVTQECVKQFVIYDISSGPQNAFKIGTVALPDNPVGKRPGITGKSDSRVFESGKHLIAVAAQEPATAPPGQARGKQVTGGPQPVPPESTMSACASCTTWVTIP